MKKTFIFNETTPSIEVFEGIFYDRDLDPDYSGEAEIDERLSLVTTRDYSRSLTSSFNGVKVFLNYGSTVFNLNNPISGLSSNSSSVLLTPQCQVGPTNYFNSSMIDANDVTASKYSYKEIYYDIRAQDSEQLESNTLHLYLKAKNPVCTFTFSVQAVDNTTGESSTIPDGGNINVNEVGDYFLLSFSNIKNTQDGNYFLSDKTVEEVADYIKLDMGDGTFGLTLDGFTTTIATSDVRDSVVLKYTVNDVIAAQEIGALRILPYMYNTMGVNEFAVNPASIHNRSKAITSTITLAVAAVAVDVVPFVNTSSLLLVDGAYYAGVPTTYSITEEVNEEYKLVKLPFEIKGASAYSYTIKASITTPGGVSPIKSLDYTFCRLSKTPFDSINTSKFYLNEGNGMTADFPSILAETINSVIEIPVPKYWSGDFTVTLTATILSDGLGGSVPVGTDTQIWKVTVNNVNQAPTWAEGFDDFGTAPVETDEL